MYNNFYLLVLVLQYFEYIATLLYYWNGDQSQETVFKRFFTLWSNTKYWNLSFCSITRLDVDWVWKESTVGPFKDWSKFGLMYSNPNEITLFVAKVNNPAMDYNRKTVISGFHPSDKLHRFDWFK